MKKFFNKIRKLLLKWLRGVAVEEAAADFNEIGKAVENYYQMREQVIDAYMQHINILYYQNNKPIYAEYTMCEMCTNKGEHCDDCIEHNMCHFTLFNIDNIKKMMEK